MKSIIFLMILIFSAMVSPSITAKVKKAAQAQQQSNSLKKINQKGEYQPLYGYTIAAMIDTNLTEAAEKIEEFIRKNLKKSYATLPISSYHMTIYNIYTCGKTLIPPVQRWEKSSGQTVDERSWLPMEVLHEQNTEAMCIIEKYLNETLNIKYADINVDKGTISLTLELEQESLQRIRDVRMKLAKVYERTDSSLEPINEKLKITLAYAYGQKKTLDLDVWNQLNLLSRPFNMAKLSLPSVYLFASMKEYIRFRKNDNCSAYI